MDLDSDDEDCPIPPPKKVLKTTNADPPVKAEPSKPVEAPGSVIVHHNDCVEVMKNMPENSVDFVLADPPYDRVLEPTPPSFCSDSLDGQTWTCFDAGTTVLSMQPGTR